ncbi:MAG: hypothetical protein JST54_09580 [Deltaproteobacteria bacterium]|nr:hypothetical protein [Deltaproteobacteria bacterium]
MANAPFNRDLLASLAEAHLTGLAQVLAVGSPGARRELWVRSGSLVGTRSEFVEDRLGDLLAARGKLDPDLVGSIGAVARASHLKLGELLILEELITASELATALDEQVRVVFARALSTPGPVAVSDAGSAATEHTVRFSIGETMLAAFRLDVPLEVVSGFVHAMLDESVKLHATAAQLDALKLRPAELRLVRQLGTGASGLASTDLPARTEQEIRLLGALVALGLLA